MTNAIENSDAYAVSYQDAIASLAASDEGNGKAQNAFVPVAILRLAYGSLTLERLMADLCVGLDSKKGKANMETLRLNRRSGSMAAFASLRSIFGTAKDKDGTAYDRLPAIKAAADGFAQVIPDTMIADYVAAMDGDSDIIATLAAYDTATAAIETATAEGATDKRLATLKGAATKALNAHDEAVAAFKADWLDAYYPGRPTSVSALDKAVKAALAEENKAVRVEAEQAAAKEETALAIEAALSEAGDMDGALRDMADEIAAMNEAGRSRYLDAIRVLMAACGDAIAAHASDTATTAVAA